MENKPQQVTMILDLAQIKKQKHIGKYFTLTVIEGNDFGCIFQLNKPEIILGRKSTDAADVEIDLEIDDASASRRHLKLAKRAIGQDGESYVVAVDLGSKNGTMLNDEPLPTTEVELTDGDKIKIGVTVIKFEIRERPEISYHERLYTQATRDPQTGLWNQNYVKQELEKLLSSSSRRNEPFSVLVMELDFLQVLTETYGQVADTILRASAQKIMNELSDYETAARWSGKEFIALLPESELQAGINTAERLRRAIESFDFTSIGCPQRITMSVGVAQFPSSGRTADQLVTQAQEALYQAKQTGHNRICTAEVKVKTSLKESAAKVLPKLLLLIVLVVAAIMARNAYIASTSESANQALIFSGTVEMREVQVASKVGGRVSEVLIKEGDQIKKGQPMVRFDIDDLLARRNQIKARIAQAEAELTKLKNGNRKEEIAQAEAAAAKELAELEEKRNGPVPQEKLQGKAELEGAQADLNNAELIFKRVDKLYADGAESKQARDDAEARMKVAQTRVEAARAKLDILEIGTRDEQKKLAEEKYKQALANVALLRVGARYEDIASAQARLDEQKAQLEQVNVLIEEGEILAPSDCQIEVVSVRPGDVMPINKPVALLLEKDQIWGRIYVPEPRLGEIRVGQKVSLKVDTYPNQTFPGYVEQIFGEAEFFRRNIQIRNDREYQVFAVKVHLDNKDGIFKSGMSIEAKLEK